MDGKLLSAPKAIKCVVLGWDERRIAWRLAKSNDYSALKFSGHVTMNMDDFPARATSSGADGGEIYDFITDNRQCTAPVTPDPDEPPVTIAASRGRRAVTPSAQAIRNAAGGDSAFITHGDLFTTMDDWSYVSSCYQDPHLPDDDYAFLMLDEFAYAILNKTDPVDWIAAMPSELDKWPARRRQKRVVAYGREQNNGRLDPNQKPA